MRKTLLRIVNNLNSYGDWNLYNFKYDKYIENRRLYDILIRSQKLKDFIIDDIHGMEKAPIILDYKSRINYAFMYIHYYI